jgi:type I restriction enzyme M protein
MTQTALSANLDVKNPNAAADLEHLPPEQLVAEIMLKEKRIFAIMEEIKDILTKKV